jgi:2-C-methyl-D-erythritol 4-phosphate cytidylyltransferase
MEEKEKRFAAVVLSAGVGKRMGSDVPKQYLPINKKPVIYYSLKAFEESPVSEIVLVTGKDDVDYCRKEIVEKYRLQKVAAIVPGGRERYDSVYEGLKAVRHADYVLIHDGARPMITSDIIARSMETVQLENACVAGMPVKDTIKRVDEKGYTAETPDRRFLWQMQTPQTFSYPLILEAYEKLQQQLNETPESLPTITDDAMVAEHFLHAKVKMIEGSYENIKITTQEDLLCAELFLKK